MVVAIPPRSPCGEHGSHRRLAKAAEPLRGAAQVPSREHAAPLGGHARRGTCRGTAPDSLQQDGGIHYAGRPRATQVKTAARSEEHTSELQSRENLVCRLLLEKKK